MWHILLGKAKQRKIECSRYSEWVSPRSGPFEHAYVDFCLFSIAPNFAHSHHCLAAINASWTGKYWCQVVLSPQHERDPVASGCVLWKDPASLFLRLEFQSSGAFPLGGFPICVSIPEGALRVTLVKPQPMPASPPLVYQLYQ